MSKNVIVLDGVEYELIGETPRQVAPKWPEKSIPRIGQSWVPREALEAYPGDVDLDPAGNPFGADGGGRFCLGLKGKSVQLRAEDRVLVVRPIEARTAPPAALDELERLREGLTEWADQMKDEGLQFGVDHIHPGEVEGIIRRLLDGEPWAG